MPRYHLRLCATLFSLAALSSCGSVPEVVKANTPVFARYADDAAVSEQALKDAIAPFFDNETMAETRAVVIMHGGLIVAERYAPGYTPETKLISWSMAKSVTATLVGFMVADGLLVLDDPAPVSEWANAGDALSRITLRQLLHMSSGIDHTEVPEEGKTIYEADTPRMLFLDGRENVARYAPPAWHSPGSIVDASYEALDRIARSADDSSEDGRNARMPGLGLTEPALLTEPPEWLSAASPRGSAVEGRDVWLLHPWSLGDLPADLAPDTLVIGLLLSDFHRIWPWDEGRWRFVGTRMAELTSLCWHGDADVIGQALRSARRVRSVAEPHLMPWLAQWAECVPAPMLFPKVDRPCSSFSQWWTRASRGSQSASELLDASRQHAR